MLASYFPKPANRLMGNWALSQAQAFLRNGVDVRVISGTAWIPKALASVSSGAAGYADCPLDYRWGDLPVSYPRWFFYPVPALRGVLEKNPAPIVRAAWWAVRKNVLDTVAAFRPDLVYAHHTQVNGYLAWQIHRATGLPYAITDHDFGEIEACRHHPARHRFFEPIVLTASRMIAVASRMEQTMRDLFPGARTATIQNGAEFPSAAAFAQSRPLEMTDKRVFFCACAFYERKGVPLLVRAFARVAARFPDVVLRIAGDGATRPEVEAAIAATGISSRVQMLGRLPHDRVLQEMVWADAFVLPGWDEPFATAFTEALSAGCPIIYASDGGITDVVRDGIHGLAVEPRSEDSLVAAMESLLWDEPRRRKMAAAARELFDRQLHWDHNAIRMRSVFEAAVGHAVPVETAQ